MKSVEVDVREPGPGANRNNNIVYNRTTSGAGLMYAITVQHCTLRSYRVSSFFSRQIEEAREEND